MRHTAPYESTRRTCVKEPSCTDLCVDQCKEARFLCETAAYREAESKAARFSASLSAVEPPASHSSLQYPQYGSALRGNPDLRLRALARETESLQSTADGDSQNLHE